VTAAGAAQFTTGHQRALQYMALSVRHFSVVVEWDNDDEVWVTHVQALDSLSSYGDTREAALESTREAIAGYLEAAAKGSIPLPRSGPEPSIVELEVSLS
jgi:predicted RNase H-like HicB family nuclease